mmetsp:Transcript_35073/g.90976  ORF Transcript_35073/g.90976 Transcript_35073/m.90976 type:complete len:84 (-) Transcript_35073:1371-1622(-)
MTAVIALDVKEGLHAKKSRDEKGKKYECVRVCACVCECECMVMRNGNVQTINHSLLVVMEWVPSCTSVYYYVKVHGNCTYMNV